MLSLAGSSVLFYNIKPLFIALAQGKKENQMVVEGIKLLKSSVSRKLQIAIPHLGASVGVDACTKGRWRLVLVDAQNVESSKGTATEQKEEAEHGEESEGFEGRDDAPQEIVDNREAKVVRPSHQPPWGPAGARRRPIRPCEHPRPPHHRRSN
ncbi:uncharacterized protein G2W53_023435 [Senna tora]|uniref:Uncharacterized protein n=1 Tax=Senna tora TaxID=362788 RepID=A0A834TA31_9FABA|nr:uncharacterized protein G2W53_023435 [Senna tora]